MPTKSALGLCAAGIWDRCVDRALDRKWISSPLFRVWIDYFGLRCGKEKVGIDLSYEEYISVAKWDKE